MWQPINPIKYKKKEKKQHETKLEYKEDTTNYQMTKQEWNENIYIYMLHSEVEQKFNSLWSGFADNKAATKIGLSDYRFS